MMIAVTRLLAARPAPNAAAKSLAGKAILLALPDWRGRAARAGSPGRARRAAGAGAELV
jgi:hypothetical protein